ncbi:hypothetical protein ACFO1B_02200 [Dactylosporangium siamense]|uniref:Uncharacterized protein n=1 Tax=Dactylosporangium siamense TaxID=685454 RepID=A0A919PQU9_9ACTN|nr:hypothetical protein [Dactylosporangium siamense]GIG48479.1 hypothetical protein Dsi01nite_065200 [Dactylosporangium siamense]
MLAALLAEIDRQGGYDAGVGPEPVVGLELFFDGNDAYGSIGCNLIEHPGPATFYRVLRAVRDRPDVHGVWVGISELTFPDEWPFSDHVYVVTTASAEAVAAWAASLSPDEPGYGWWGSGPPLRPIEVPAGAHVVTLWWD